MVSLSWIIFVVLLAGIYILTIIIDSRLNKKWNFKISSLSILLMIVASALLTNSAGIVTDEYIKNNVSHEWKEQIVSVKEVEDIVRSREKEGSFFFGVGDINERETFRYTVVGKDGVNVREKLYTSDCYILKADDKKQRIVYLRNVRIYKNPDDKKFYGSSSDVSHGFYRVYIL